jgi:hypothetical protein
MQNDIYMDPQILLMIVRRALSKVYSSILSAQLDRLDRGLHIVPYGF